MKKKQVVKQAAKKAGNLVKVGHVDDIPDAKTRADVKRRMGVAAKKVKTPDVARADKAARKARREAEEKLAEAKKAKRAAADLGLGEQEWILESLLHAGMGVVLTAEVARELAAYTGAKSWEELATDLGGTHRTIRGGQLVLVFREVPACIR